MGFFSKLFGKKNYDEELKMQSNNLSEQSIFNEQISNFDKNVSNSDFAFRVEDVFTITGRGTVATGRVLSGSIYIGNIVVVNEITTTVLGIESFRRELNIANAGDSVGILLKNIKRDQIHRGDMITKQKNSN